MIQRAFRCASLWVAIGASVASAQTPAGQDTLSAARDLYASAAYEDALAVLNRLHAAGRPPDEARAIDQYRAYCFLALGRVDEAERAIEAIVAANPSYHPTEADVSPRLRSAFTEVRRRMLPSIAQSLYVEAKGAFDRKEFAVAAAWFKGVNQVLADPDLGAAASAAPLSDLRILAAGFQELSERAAAAAPTSADARPAAGPAAAIQSGPGARPGAAQPPAVHSLAGSDGPRLAAGSIEPRSAMGSDGVRGARIYATDDTNVTPPVVVRQSFPTYRGGATPPQPGIVEVIINERGTVESASIKASMSPDYDRATLAAVRGWRYKPARLNGAPVKYRQLIQIVTTSR